MAEQTDLGVLACGDPDFLIDETDCELAEILTHLRDCIDNVWGELIWLGNQEPARVSSFGPFLGRTLLELGTTALVGRLDQRGSLLSSVPRSTVTTLLINHGRLRCVGKVTS